jgi:flagellar protein FlaF
MHQAASAYRSVSRQIAGPRELEADLLLTAASRLQSVHDGWNDGHKDLPAALTYNRRLWTIFLGSVTDDSNPLPAEIRQNVANLGLFVIKQSLAVLANPKRESLVSLIGINREIAAGLLGRA